MLRSFKYLCGPKLRLLTWSCTFPSTTLPACLPVRCLYRIAARALETPPFTILNGGMQGQHCRLAHFSATVDSSRKETRSQAYKENALTKRIHQFVQSGKCGLNSTITLFYQEDLKVHAQKPAFFHSALRNGGAFICTSK